MKYTVVLAFVLAIGLAISHAQAPLVPFNEMQNIQDPASALTGTAKTNWYTLYNKWVFGVMTQADGWPHYDMGAYPGIVPGISQYNIYLDSCCEYSTYGYYTIYEAADSNGFNPEHAFYHYSIDWQSNCVTGSKTQCYLSPNLDQFDGFEQPGYGTIADNFGRDPYFAVHGAWNCAGTSCVDVTRAAYCPAPQPSYLVSQCENLAPSPITMTDHMLLGRQIPFYVIHVTVNTGRAGAGSGVTYKYWNGTTYATLTPTSDTTNQLSTSGAISFVPPADWKRNSDADATTAIAASGANIINCWTPGTAAQSNKIDCPKFHVIMQLTGSPTTNPVIGRVWSDSGLTPIATETASTVAISHSGSTYTATIVTSGTNVFTTPGQQVLLSGFSTVGLNGQWNAITAASNSSQIVTTWTVCTTAGCPADQAATADAGTAVVYTNRGWGALAGAGGTACSSGVVNASDPELAYCATPGAGSSARIPGEARLLAGYSYYQMMGNQLQDSVSGKYPWAYVKAQDLAINLALVNPSGAINGVWWDDIAFCIGVIDYNKTETLGQSCNAVTTIFLPALNTLIHADHPGYKNTGNTGRYYINFGLAVPGLDETHLENASWTSEQTTPDTDTALAICSDQTWCSKTTICQDALTNPSSTCKSAASSFLSDGTTVAFYYGQYPGKLMAGTHLDFLQYALLDGKSKYHSWDMGNQGPIASLAMWHLIRNPNVLYNYQSINNTVQAGGDDYMVWTVSPSTLNQSLSAGSTCAGCTLNLSGVVDSPTPPKPCTQTISNICGLTHTNDAPIRITNSSGQRDVLPASNYTVNGSNQLTMCSAGACGTIGIVYDHAIGDKIEYMVQNFQSQKSWQTNSWLTPAFRTTAQDATSIYGVWSYHIPASDIYLGVPDASNTYDAPCRYSTVDRALAAGAFLKDCQWKDGPTISGNSALCDAVAHNGGQGVCAALVRRDFKNGSYGKAIVLLRPTSASNSWTYTTASNEYDQASQTITLPDTYYRVNSDGTIDRTPITTLTLKAREGFIGVTQPGGVPNITSGVSISGGGVIR